MKNCYGIRRTVNPVDLAGDFDLDPVWKNAEELRVAVPSVPVGFKRPTYTPPVRFKLLYDDAYLYGQFLVRDRYVRIRCTKDQQAVCRDACVELFLQPADNTRYFNFEFSAGGSMLTYHITHLRSGNYRPVGKRDRDTIRRFHTLGGPLEHEIESEITWRLSFAIPFALFGKYANPTALPPHGRTWRANVMHCSECSSHPRWLSWQPLPQHDFHLPEAFGEMRFGQ